MQARSTYSSETLPVLFGSRGSDCSSQQSGLPGNPVGKKLTTAGFAVSAPASGTCRLKKRNKRFFFTMEACRLTLKEPVRPIGIAMIMLSRVDPSIFCAFVLRNVQAGCGDNSGPPIR